MDVTYASSVQGATDAQTHSKISKVNKDMLFEFKSFVCKIFLDNSLMGMIG